MFTFLEDFRANPEGAEPYLGVTMYDELAPASGLVLLRGKVSPGRLSKEEGGDLLGLMEKYYSDVELYADFVETFNHRPDDFDFDAHCGNVP